MYKDEYEEYTYWCWSVKVNLPGGSEGVAGALVVDGYGVLVIGSKVKQWHEKLKKGNDS